jgi:hypothetical protein
MRSILCAGFFLLMNAAMSLAPTRLLGQPTEAPKPAYDFSLPREERIKLAESGAPPEVSSKATGLSAGANWLREGARGHPTGSHASWKGRLR